MPGKARKTIPRGKIIVPEDIRYHVYTNDEIMAILRNYVERLSQLSWQEPSPATVNEITMYLDRMTFLLAQIKRVGK